MAPLGLGVGPVGVGRLLQVRDGLSQPGWVQPPGGRHQHRLRLGGGAGGEVVGAGSQHRGVGGRQLPGAQGLGGPGEGAAEQGPGGPDGAVGGGGAQPQPTPQPAGGRGGRDGLLGPGGPAAVDGGQPPEPLALKAVDQPPQPQGLLGEGGVGQPVEVLGGQPINHFGERPQPLR
jgi:hypothetical protein